MISAGYAQELYPAERAVLNELISVNNLIQPYSNIPITLDNSFLLEQIPFGGGIPTYQTEENCTSTFCRITSLDFSNFNVTTIPESFNQLILLESLNLSNNNIEEIPYSFFSLNNIQYLDFSNNLLTEIFSGIGSQDQIYHLNLSANNLTSLPSSIDLLPNLSYLNVSLNNITDFEFTELSNITTLFINGNNISELDEIFCELNINWADYDNIVMDNHLCSNIPSCLVENNTVGNQFCNQSQRDFLQSIISQNSLTESSSIQDNDNLDSSFDPIELGYQRWELGEIVELNLSSNPVNNFDYGYEISNFPSNISTLISLKKLNLGNNQLTEIPEDIGLLTDLKTLRYDNNFITGNLTSGGVPTSIGLLENLEVLSLANNFITIPNPEIYSLINLTELYLNNNQIYYIDNNLGDLEELNILHLNNNEISSIPNEIRFLDHLIDLKISFNQLFTFNSNLRYLNELQYLDIGNNYIQEIPSSINQMLNLREVKLNNNQISTLPNQIFSLQNLNKLHLQYNSIFELDDDFDDLDNLNELKLHYNQLHELPSSVCNIDVDYSLSAIELNNSISFHQNYFCFNLPSCIGSHDESQDIIGEQDCYGSDIQVLSELLEINEIFGNPANLGIWEDERLVELYMPNQGIVELPTNFGYLAELRNLDLSQNSISDIPLKFRFLVNLDSLDLNNNELVNLPIELNELESLKSLKLSNNQFENFPEVINNLPTLEYLELISNQIVSIPNDLSNLTDLIEMNVSGNFIDFIPENIGQLVNLKSLDISNNNLEYLPDGIGELPSLEEFNIQNNKLVLLPEGISELNNLININFSNNSLVELESGIFNNTNLLNINLSNNDLLRLPNSICNSSQAEIDLTNNYLFCTLGLINDSYYGYMDDALIPGCVDEMSNIIGLNSNYQGCEYYGCTADQESETGEALNYNENATMSCSFDGTYENLNDCCLFVEGPEIYVSSVNANQNPGSDVSGDGSENNPFATIQKAVQLAGHNDVVIVEPGEYYENIEIENKDAISIISKAVNESDEILKQFYIENTIINGNNYNSCFDIVNSGDSLLEISGFTLKRGRSNSGGGGIKVSNSKGTFEDIIVNYNSSNENGGGIYITGTSNITINNSIIDTNLSVVGSGLGGGIYVEGLSSLELNNTKISRNKSNNGGGVYLNNHKNVTITDCLIESNEATNSGGGLFNTNDSLYFPHFITQINNIPDTILTVFKNNESNLGGGIFQQNNTTTLEGLKLINNHANQDGGGIYIKDINNQYNNLIFNGNTSDNFGSAVFIDDSNLDLYHFTIYENPTHNNSVIYASNGSILNLINSILWNLNEILLTGGDIISEIELNHTLVPNENGETEINIINPEFDNFDNFELSRVSAALGSGLYNSDLPTHDIYGNQRINSSNVENHNFPDLGAVENEFGEIILENWFVSFNGDNSTDGLDENDPIKSINLAIEKSLNGDRVYIKNGNYYENISFNGKNVKLMNFEYFSMGATECIDISENTEENIIIEGEDISPVIQILEGEDDVEICGFTVTGGEHQNGAGIFIENSNPKIMNINFTENYAYQNGGGIYGNNFNGVLKNIKLNSNVASGDGAGIYLDNSSPEMDNIHFENNENRLGNYELNGGGLYLNNSDINIFNEIKFINNTASKNGGGLYINNSNIENATNIEFISNRANQNGGGIYSINSTLNFGGTFITKIIDNESTVDGGGFYISSSIINGNYLEINNNNSLLDGGAFFIDDEGELYLSNSDIIGNNALEDGGAINLNGYNTKLDLSNCNIFENRSETSSILYTNNGEVKIKNTLIENNNSFSYPGGILAKNSNISLFNVTLTENKINNPEGGGNINIEQYGNIFIINSIIWQNTGTELYLRPDGYPKSLLASHSTIENGRDGIVNTFSDSVYYYTEFNNTEDPKFISPEERYYYVTTESPCVDAGISLFPPNAGGNIDTVLYIPEDKIVDGDGDGIALPDMGAYDKEVLSIYPGDLNNNGMVELSDLNSLICHFNLEGIPRFSKGIHWNLNGYGAIAWDSYGNIPGSALTYADANGDGVINERDILSIGLNWENNHDTYSSSFEIPFNDNNEPDCEIVSSNIQTIYNGLSGSGEGFDEIKSYLEKLLNIEAIPIEFSLRENFPNPFNPSTNIFFSLPRNSRVTLDIYNIKGELIQRLINNKSYPLGHHSIKFDGKQLSSGVYFYKLKSGKFEQTHKMMLVK